MATRPFGSLCSLLLVWLCALGAGPARHPAVTPVVARGAVALLLRDVADAPRLAPEAVAARLVPLRSAVRHAASSQLPVASLRTSGRAWHAAEYARAIIGDQGIAHAARARWRVYDAVAPPRTPL